MGASTALIPVTVGEYLGSVYRPDMDYVDGVLESRNLGEFDHADLQLGVGTMLRNRQREGGCAGGHRGAGSGCGDSVFPIYAWCGRMGSESGLCGWLRCCVWRCYRNEIR